MVSFRSARVPALKPLYERRAAHWLCAAESGIGFPERVLRLSWNSRRLPGFPFRPSAYTPEVLQSTLGRSGVHCFYLDSPTLVGGGSGCPSRIL